MDCIKGIIFLNWIKNIIKNKTNNEDITFLELNNKGFKELKVFATDLNMRTVKEFSYKKTPNVIVAEAIRASMSIPFFFKAWKFSNSNPDDHIYVDGGVLFNYPITTYEDSYSKTLGFYLYNSENNVSNLDYNSIIEYTKTLFETITSSDDIIEKEETINNITIKINNLGISSTNFNISSDMEEKLFNSGKDATIQYINKIKNI